jgi:hypothetical protein
LSTGDSQKDGEGRISWHPAFLEAMRLELEQYGDRLEFKPEYQLTSESLRIDLLIIKKPKNLVITKNIAAIFRETNIIEYKSPDDYVSVEDFYKVYGYACLYIALNKTPVTDITITFVENRYPRNLTGYLKTVRRFDIEESGPGIYTVRGDAIPIQIIEGRRLPAEENAWLRDLDHGLDPAELIRISTKIDRLGKAANIGAYTEALFRANSAALREVLTMSDAAVTLEKVFEETGLIRKWEARGEAQSKAEVAKKLISMGLPLGQVAEATGLDPEFLTALPNNR